MFKATAPAPATVPEPAPEVAPADLVPISVLQLDLNPPSVGGWDGYLAAKGVTIMVDDIGRASVSRADAKQLLDEQRELESKRREAAAEVERRLIEQDQQRRAQIWGGLPADYLPPGVAPAAAMLQAAQDARPRRLTPLEHALSNSGELTYHPIQNEE